MLVNTDNSNYKRDTTNNALINNNIDELNLLKAQREKEVSRQSQIDDLKKQIEDLKRIILER